jgi:hypothetical protein
MVSGMGKGVFRERQQRALPVFVEKIPLSILRL